MKVLNLQEGTPQAHGPSSTVAPRRLCTALDHQHYKQSMTDFLSSTQPLRGESDFCDGILYRNCPRCRSTLAFIVDKKH